MIALEIFLDGDGCWPDLTFPAEEAKKIAVALLDGGTTDGKPTVTIRFDTDRGVVLGQTTLRLFCTAAKMFEAKYPGLFDEP